MNLYFVVAFYGNSDYSRFVRAFSPEEALAAWRAQRAVDFGELAELLLDSIEWSGDPEDPDYPIDIFQLPNEADGALGELTWHDDVARAGQSFRPFTSVTLPLLELL